MNAIILFLFCFCFFIFENVHFGMNKDFNYRLVELNTEYVTTSAAVSKLL